MESTTKIRVAVIGAGAAGLAALRHLSADPTKFVPVAFEMTPHVAGTWVYSDEVDTEDLLWKTSMYKNLRTNLTKELMAFPGFPFSKDLPSFITHLDVRKYLEDYATHYRLYQYIQFCKKVVHVKPLSSTTGTKTTWSVDIQDVIHSTTETHQFNAVMVCNGHFSTPLLPDLPGLLNFRGQVMHSKDYRQPEVFSGKVVIALGAANSGQDVSVDLSPFAKWVYLSHRHDPLPTVLPDNVSQVTGIKDVRTDSVILENGSEVQVDVILLCTGYIYDFPFMDEECRPEIEGRRIKSLYKHVIEVRHPTLSFIGICNRICPFPHFDGQVQYVLATLCGDVVLPSMADMKKDIRKDFEWRLSQGMPIRDAHKMGPLQFTYHEELALLVGFPPVSEVIKKLYDHVVNCRQTQLLTYKNSNFRLISDTEFVENKYS